MMNLTIQFLICLYFFRNFSAVGSLEIIINSEYSEKGDSYRVGVGSLKNRKLEYVFEEFIDDAAENGVEFLVLPELSLIDLPEKIEIGTDPCTIGKDKLKSLYKSSCSCKRNNIMTTYTMVEIGESCKEIIDDLCWYFGHYLYNTAVVIGTNGTIVTKYRKEALFPPDTLILKPGTGDPTTFDTDFGVTFGVFICFEVFTHRPAWVMVEELGIDHIAFPTKFHDFIPITSLGIQQAFSEFFKVTFLAANNLESEGDIKSSGSGIYVSGKPLVWTSEHDDILLITDLPLPKKNDELPSQTKKKNDPEEKNEKKKTKFSDDDDEDEKHQIFKAENGLSMNISLSIPLIDCEMKFTMNQVQNDKNGKKEDDEYFVAYVASRKFTYEKIFKTNLTSYICTIINCGNSEKECEKGIESQFLKNIYTSTSFSSIELSVSYNFDVDSIFALRNTDEKKLFEWGSFDYQPDVDHNKARITSVPEVLGDQSVLFVGLGYFDLGM